MSNKTFQRKQALEKEVKDLYLETEYIAQAAAAGSWNLTTDVAVSAVATGSSRNGDTVTLSVNAAASNPTDTVLATVTGTASAVDIAITPNDGTNNSSVASGATSGLADEITFSSISKDATRNGDIIMIAVEPDNDNPTDTVLIEALGSEDVTILKVTPNDGTNNPAGAATASMATSTPIVLTSVQAPLSANGDTFTSQVLAAAANPTDTVLAAFTGTADAITCTITPNDGTNNPVAQAVATMTLTDDITLTSVAAGSSRNTETFTSQVLAAAANPTDTVLATFAGTAAAITCTITPNDGTNNPANAQAVATMTLTDDITLTSVAKGASRNTETFTSQVLAAAANPTDTVLAAFTGTSAAITCTITPNDGSNNPSNVAAYASTYGLNTEIVLTKANASSDENSETFTLQIAAAAANPTDTVLAVWSGTAAATVLTITPNDGTNNGSVPVYVSSEEIVELINNGSVSGKTVTVTDGGGIRTDVTATGGDSQLLQDGQPYEPQILTFANGTSVAVNMTTAELVELINTGAVAGKNVTVTDASGFRALQTATGGGSDNLADSGEGDGVAGTFGSGTDVAVNMTTAELVELINTGAVAGKNVTVTDASGFRVLQTATGGGSDNLADAGEGDGVAGTFGSGTNPVVNLTTAELVELINTGAVAGKNVTVTDASSLRVNQTATGGAADVLVDAGEGDGVVGTFSGGSEIAVNLTTAELREAIATGAVVGKTVTITDVGGILSDLTASGGGAANLADSGEGDGVMATLLNGVATPVNLTTAEVAELVRTGSVAGKTVTVTDVGVLLSDLTASGGDSTSVAASGEGDGAIATLTGGTDVSSFQNETKWGISSISETSAGLFRITLEDMYASLKFFDAVIESSTEEDLNLQIKAEDVNGSTPYIDFFTLASGVATSPEDGDIIKCHIEVKNTSII